MRIAEGPPSTDVTGPFRLPHSSSGSRFETSGSPGSSRADDENSSVVFMAIVFTTAGILSRIQRLDFGYDRAVSLHVATSFLRDRPETVSRSREGPTPTVCLASGIRSWPWAFILLTTAWFTLCRRLRSLWAEKRNSASCEPCGLTRCREWLGSLGWAGPARPPSRLASSKNYARRSQACRPVGLFVWSFYQEPDVGFFLQELFQYFGRPGASASPAKGAGLLHLLREALIDRRTAFAGTRRSGASAAPGEPCGGIVRAN